MLKAEREIVTLRTKLGEPLPGPCLRIAEAYERELRRRDEALGPRVSAKRIERAVVSNKKEAARKALNEIGEAEEQA